MLIGALQPEADVEEVEVADVECKVVDPVDVDVQG